MAFLFSSVWKLLWNTRVALLGVRRGFKAAVELEPFP